MHARFSLQHLEGGSPKARISALDFPFHLNVYQLGRLTDEPAGFTPESAYHALFSETEPLLFTILKLDDVLSAASWPDQLVIDAIRFYCEKQELTSLLRIDNGAYQAIYHGDAALLEKHLPPANFFDGDEDLLTDALTDIDGIPADEYNELTEKEVSALLGVSLRGQ